MLDVPRFWYKRGVAGFRLDAVDTLFEDPSLTTIPSSPARTSMATPTWRTSTTPSCRRFTTCCKLRTVADEYDAVLIGETWTKDISELKHYYGDHSNELQMPMDLMFSEVNKLSAPEFRRQIAARGRGNGWPVFLSQQSRHAPP